ncbi:MAG TPA: prolyl oligopeptidase family serine peptidase [Pyrinomonadaceae bacterium]|jgi:pimeloyl-ACP methyl ester carboxylesterase|nr:prolyl oligopeptidase family serine peptidase [Pyrinomonadaceae bacterium]
MKKMPPGTIAIIALILTAAAQVRAESPAIGLRALNGDKYFDPGVAALPSLGQSSDSVAPTQRESDDRAANLGLQDSTLGQDADTASANSQPSCRRGDRGRPIRYEKVASYPTPASVRAYFDEWIAFYQDFYQFPPNIPVEFDYGFDSYKVTYCTIDAMLPGQSSAHPTIATGMVSVPRKAGPLPTVAYLHGTSVSFYDAVSNPHIFGEFNEGGESFDGPPSNAVFAGAGFIYVAPDYLGLGNSTVPRHRYFHAATEASSAVDLLAATRELLADLHVERNDELFIFGFSQGGHAALALHRKLQKMDVSVTGTATVGGVFDVEQWFLMSLANKTTLTLPLYVSYILLAYDDIYDVYEQPSDVFRRPYAASVGELFDMQHYFDDVLAGLPPNSRALLKPSYYAGVTENPQNPLRVRLRQNAVDRWSPYAPLRIYHSPDDEEVPYADALVSVERLRSRGADVTVRRLSNFDHVNSWVQAMPRAAKWFRSLD